MAIQFLLLPFFLLLLYGILTLRLSKRYPDAELQKLYKRGLLLKFFGGFMFFLIYKYYYVYGDTFVYFRNGGFIAELFYSDIAGFLKFMSIKALTPGAVDNDKYGYIVYNIGVFYVSEDSILMAKICAIASIITFKSYLFSSFFFSAFSFYGLWKMFMVFDKRYPHLRKYLFYAIFCFPSVLFWGSGILKDTLTLGCLGLIFFHLDSILFRGKIKIRHFVILIVASYVILILKGYILLAFLPPVMLGIYRFYLSRINSNFAKVFIGIFLLVGFVFGGSFLLQYFGQVSQKFSLEKMATMAEGFNNYHTYLDESGQAGSGYSLHITSYSLSGMLAVLPQAVNVTLFRPYLWEASSPVMMVSAFESMILAGFTLKVILKKGLFKFLKLILEPFALIGIVYSIILGFAIGITAFNFGALVRFKIPLIPFYLISLFIIQSIGVKTKETEIEAEKIGLDEAIVAPKEE